jgi:hypothetical protein
MIAIHTIIMTRAQRGAWLLTLPAALAAGRLVGGGIMDALDIDHDDGPQYGHHDWLLTLPAALAAGRLVGGGRRHRPATRGLPAPARCHGQTPGRTQSPRPRPSGIRQATYDTALLTRLTIPSGRTERHQEGQAPSLISIYLSIYLSIYTYYTYIYIYLYLNLYIYIYILLILYYTIYYIHSSPMCASGGDETAGRPLK